MISHPDKELVEHLTNVKEIGLKIFQSKKTIWSNDEKIKKLLEIILITHDFGKGTEYFQEYIKDTDNNKWKKSPFRELKSHSSLSALFTYIISDEKINDKKYSLMAAMIVSKHHGDLEKIAHVDNAFIGKNLLKKEIIQQIDKFDFNYFNNYFSLELSKNKIDEKIEYFDYDYFCEIDEIIKSFTISDFLLVEYLFSILISADKGDAIYFDKNVDISELIKIKFSEKELEKELVDRFKCREFGNKDKNNMTEIREEIYNNIENNISDLDENTRILSINAPTGSGKTLTVLNSALKLREKIGNYKIIYALPFTSIIDQNYDVFLKVLKDGDEKKNLSSDMLLKHHSLSQKVYTNDEEKYEYEISDYLIENWDSEIIVTTFVQLLESIFSNKNRKLKKFHNIANSIIILDEVQNVPYKYWELIRSVFRKISEDLNTYFILVSATLPLIFREKEIEIKELLYNKKEYFNKFDRIDLDVSMIDEKTNIDDFCEMLRKDIKNNPDKSFLIVLNTIKSSLHVYRKIFEEFKQERNEENIIYLSTNIIPKERQKRIKLIKDNKKAVVISTQLVEAGVDIDLDIVYRDFGPLDSINQTAGRCNRNSVKSKGIVKIFRISDTKKDYYQYIYSDILIESTREALKSKGSIIEEKDFMETAEKYYEILNSKKSDDISINILNAMKELDFDKAFEKFGIIDKSFKTVDMFIELDDKAEKVLEKYKELKNLKLYDRKKAFDEFKSEFLSYVISVPAKGNEIRDGSDFYIIEKSMIEQNYDENTGYIRDSNQEDYIF